MPGTDDVRSEPVRAEGGWLTVRPMPTAEELRAFYADVYYQELSSSTYQASYDEEELAYKRLRVDVLLAALAQAGAAPTTGPLLEVGVGEGFLMAAAAGRGWEVVGVDHSTFAVERFHPEMLDRLAQGDAEEHLAARAVDGPRVGTCVLVNVLEHVRDPEGLLRTVREVLLPGGLAAVTVPNDDSPLQHELRRRGAVDGDQWFAPPQHLSYFNTETARRIATVTGFDVVDHFADFPIDWYLMHPGSSYATDPAQGKAAHRARIAIELLLARAGIDRVLDLGRALAACGAGRDQTLVLRPRP